MSLADILAQNDPVSQLLVETKCFKRLPGRSTIRRKRRIRHRKLAKAALLQRLRSVGGDLVGLWTPEHQAADGISESAIVNAEAFVFEQARTVLVCGEKCVERGAIVRSEERRVGKE